MVCYSTLSGVWMKKEVVGWKFVKDTSEHIQKKQRICLNALKAQPERIFNIDELIEIIGYKHGRANRKAADVVLYRLKSKGLANSVLDLKEYPASKLKREQVENSPAIKAWLKRLRSEETKEKFLYLFLEYVTWVKTKGYFESADAMLEHKQFAQNDKDRYQHINMIEDYLEEKNFPASKKKSTYTAIRSFYKHNKAELPSYIIRFNDKEPRHIVTQQPITLDEVRQLLTNADPRMKAVFLCMLQSGMDRSTFTEHFNFNCWSEIAKQLGGENPDLWDLSKVPVKISLYRAKTQVRYYSFLGLDAVKALQSWLHVRQTLTGQPMKAGEPLFITSQRNPIQKQSLSITFNNLAFAAGLESRKYGKASEIRYRFHCHELRDTFRTACTVAGLDFPAAEFFIGHSVEKLGYDKSPEVYPEYFKAQFMKVEPVLNVFSNQNIDTKKLNELEHKLSDKDQVIEALVKNGIDVKEKMQKMESSREGIEALLKRVLELEKKLEKGDNKA